MTEVPQDPMGLGMGDVIRLRKGHPCGSTDWEVVRVGADVGLLCLGCGRRVMLERAVLRRRMKAVVSRGVEVDPARERALFGGIGGDDEAGENSDGGVGEVRG